MGSFDFTGVLPFILIFGVFYFLILRPQQQKMKLHQNMLANLRRGDRVVTSGGLIGTITKVVSDNEVQLEIADDIRIRHVKSLITDVLAKTDPVDANHKGSVPSNKGNVSPIERKGTPAKQKVKTKTPANRSKGKA